MPILERFSKPERAFTGTEEPPTAASEAITTQQKKCDDARLACGTDSDTFLRDLENDAARRSCVADCAKSASACNALTTRGGGLLTSMEQLWKLLESSLTSVRVVTMRVYRRCPKYITRHVSGSLLHTDAVHGKAVSPYSIL